MVVLIVAFLAVSNGAVGGNPWLGRGIAGVYTAFLTFMLLLMLRTPKKGSNWVEISPTGIAAAVNGKVSSLPREEMDRALWVEYDFPRAFGFRPLGVQPTIIVLGKRPGSFVRIHPGFLSRTSLEEALALAAIPIETIPGVFTATQFNRQFAAYTETSERNLPKARTALTIVLVVLIAVLLIGISVAAIAFAGYELGR